MSDFTASNGIPVSITSRGYLVVDDADAQKRAVLAAGKYVEAIAEFFRAREDDRFDRWRWPANPEYVVYAWTADPARTARGVTVLSESIPRGYTVWEDNIDTLYGTSENEEARATARKAARAWFDAHPEPKPWHKAKPAEGWLLTIDGEIVVAVRGADEDFIHAKGVTPWSSQAITAGRRVWPEVAS